MVGFYKHHIPVWMDGTAGLNDGAHRAYHVIVQLIMLNEGPIARNEGGIAGRCNQTLKTFLRNPAELIDAGKILVVEGKLDNGRAAAKSRPDRMPPSAGPAELLCIVHDYAASTGGHRQ